jgi:excisionase family DNA binding protein
MINKTIMETKGRKKMIQVTEAAKMLGVNRQTLENWGKNGTIKIHKPNGRSHWVDKKTIEAFADTMQDIEHTREMLNKEKEHVDATLCKERQTRRDIERELYMINKFNRASCINEFYSMIPNMCYDLGMLKERERDIMCAIINGKDVGFLSDCYGLTRDGIMQIFYRGCNKCRELTDIKKRLDDYDRLKTEVRQLRQSMSVMSKDLKVQRETERKIQEMNEQERINRIKKTDKILRLLDTRIVTCGMSVRTTNILKSADIETIGDLIQMKKIDLLKYRNCGKKSISEMSDFLDKLGFAFETDISQLYRDRIALYAYNNQ